MRSPLATVDVLSFEIESGLLERRKKGKKIARQRDKRREKGTKEDYKRTSAAKEPGADLKLEIYINFTWIHFLCKLARIVMRVGLATE